MEQQISRSSQISQAHTVWRGCEFPLFSQTMSSNTPFTLAPSLRYYKILELLTNQIHWKYIIIFAYYAQCVQFSCLSILTQKYWFFLLYILIIYTSLYIISQKHQSGCYKLYTVYFVRSSSGLVSFLPTPKNMPVDGLDTLNLLDTQNLHFCLTSSVPRTDSGFTTTLTRINPEDEGLYRLDLKSIQTTSVHFTSVLQI